MKLCFPMIDQVCAHDVARVTIVLSREKFTWSERDKLFPMFISRTQLTADRNRNTVGDFSKCCTNIRFIDSNWFYERRPKIDGKSRGVAVVIIAREISNPLLC